MRTGYLFISLIGVGWKRKSYLVAAYMFASCRQLWTPRRQLSVRGSLFLHSFARCLELRGSMFFFAACRYHAAFMVTIRPVIIFSAACVLGAVLTANTTFCRPFDTPDYLIPYYLRDVTTRFKHYASHRRRKGETKYMTLEDFVRALLASKDKNESLDSSVVEGVAQLFRELDADGNMYLSLTEFSFIMLLLTARLDDIQKLFYLMDKDCTGTLGLDEFAGVLRGLGCSQKDARVFTRGPRNGIVRRLFGDDGQRRSSYEEIAETINTIKEEIWKAEFRQVDTEHQGRITAEQFGQLIASQMIGRHTPFHIVDNIRKMRGKGCTLTLDSWVSFHRVMQHADVMADAVELFTSSGLPLLKKDFSRAVKAAGLPSFTEVELDLIMALFDRNSNGVLEFDEFLSVMEKKLNYHYKSCTNLQNKKNLPARFIECVGEVLHW